jgi:hypothetical protein
MVNTDYAPLLLALRSQLKEFESCMTEREFKKAYELALAIVTESRLLLQITKESHL